MKKLIIFLFLLVLAQTSVSAQCFSLPNYCNPTFVNITGVNIGLQNVTIGSGINNSSVATGNAPNYFDYTGMSAAGAPGSVVSVSVVNGGSNSTEARMYVDYNNDGAFSTSTEVVWTSTTTTAGQTSSGSFTIPTGTPSGIYRLRVTGDFPGQTINPCALQYGEVEDYTLIVTGSTADAAAMFHTSPSVFINGNNTIGFSFVNLSSSNITSIDIGYKLDNNTPVTQTLGSLNVAPGAMYTTNFSTQLNLSSMGTFRLKAWVNNANSAGTQTAVNDTICRNAIVYCNSALSGAYTIDPAGTGSTNYKSFGAADTALKVCGISGPVVFRVANATYTYQMDITAITGSSSTNTLTFEGSSGNASSCILTAATTAALPFVVRFNACTYVKFRHMTIRGTGAANAWTVHYFNGNNNVLNNCIVEVTGTGASSTAQAYIPIIINGNLTTQTTSSSTANNHVVDSCTINNGYYGIYCSSSNGANNFYATYNTFNNPYYYGLYFNFSIVAKIRNNNISLRNNNVNSVGLYLINCNASGTNFHEIKNNKIINAGQYGMQFLTSSGSGSAYGQIHNNMIGGGFRNTTAIFGISDNSSRYQIYHNSINLDFNSAAATGINLTGGSLHDIRNNHIVISAKTILNAYPLVTTASSYISILDNNNYYNNSGFFLLGIGSANYTTSNYKAAYPSGGGLASLNLNPYYLSKTDLHSIMTCNNGANLTATVVTDFDGQTRSNPPDIGADEISSLAADDLGVMKINSPGFPLSTGSQSINVTLRNYGNNTITSANIVYAVNNGTPVSQSWSGSLSPCDTANFVFSTAHTFTAGSNNLKVFTNSPNANTDGSLINDTAEFTMCSAMNGTYTIGSSGNYSSFNAAVADLICAGVNGPVVFNVASGTYNEQVLLPAIRGASATNTITFQSVSGNPASVNLTFASSVTTNNYTFRIFSTSYVSIKNMTISATGASFGTALLFGGNTSYDSFTNVIFNGVTVTSNSTNHIVVNMNSGSISNFLLFKDCKFNNGAYGTYFQSNSNLPSMENLTITNCQYNNQYATGMYNQYSTGLILRNNTITTNSVLTSYIGMYNYWIMIPTDANRPIITGNRISGALSGTGMYNSYIGVNSTVTAARRGLVANNSIQIGSNATSTYGLRETMGNGVDYIHNSVNIGNTQTTNATAAAWFEGTSYGSNAVINNVFSNYGGGAAIRINNPTFYPTCDYNNLFSTGTNLAYLNTTVQTSLTAWRTASVRDLNSVNVNPVFTSNTDLHSNAAGMDNAGLVTSLVSTDFDNQARCPNGACPGSTSNPDIGVDEFQTVANDASISAVNNVTACSGNSSNILVSIRNIGTATLTSATVEWTVDGVAQTPFNWTGSLAQGASATGVSIGGFAFNSNLNVLKVWTTLPNGTSDGNNSNDSLTSFPKITLNGTFTIGGSNPNFANFTSAAAYLMANGVCGPVTFNVRQGTYNERIQLNAITGSSAANFVTFRKDPSNTAPAEITINNNSAAADNHTIFLNGTSFIAFEGLSITNNSPGTGANGSVIRLALIQDSVTFKNNIITGPFTTSTAQSFAVVNHTNAAANMINRFTLDGNTVRNGSFGIYLIGNSISTTFEAKNRILNNTFIDQYYTGILSQFQTEIQIIGNKITLSQNTPTGSRGIFTVGNDLFRIEKNTINNYGQYGLYLQNANNQGGIGTVKATIINNMIGGRSSGTAPYGIYFANSTPASRHINIYHNSISVTSTSQGAAFYFQNSNNYVSDLSIMNNSFANFGTGAYSSYFYFTTTYPVANLQINYNNYYSPSTSNLIYLGGTNYNVPTAGSPTYNANSRYGNPNYVNNQTNLKSRPTSTQLNDVGINLASVVTDIENDARPMSPSSTVDIGADEYNYVPSLGVLAIMQPTIPVSLGTQNVVLRVQNYSTTTVSSFTVKYKAGKTGAVRSYTWTGTLNAGTTIDHTFTGSDAYTYNGNYDTLIAWTENPNGLPDTYTADDTAKLNICRALNGVYTLDPNQAASNSNFTSFNEAIAVLNSCGILGNVVINVASGTYTQQLTVLTIPGANANRKVTIQSASGNPNDVVLNFNANALNNFTLRLMNTSYLTLRDMTISSINTGFGTTLLIANATNNRFANVTFNGISTTTTSANLAVIASPSGVASFNVFDSCRINNGSYGTYFNSNTSAPSTENIKVNACELNNQYAYGTFHQYQIGLILTNNKISTNSAYTAYTGMYNYWVLIPTDNNRAIIVGNSIKGGVSGTGMYNYYFGVNSTITANRRSLVANNMVQIGNNANASFGIRDQYGHGVDYLHNTVNIGSIQNSANSVAAFFEGTAYGLNTINNNIFSNEGGGPALRINDITYYPTSNYNNLYSTGTVLTYFNTNPLNTLADWRSNTNLDLNSMNVNPMFVSSTDLHVTEPALDNSGLVSSLVNRDIDGDPRCPQGGACKFGITKPDIGADEFDRTPPEVHAEFFTTTPSLCDGSAFSFQNASTTTYSALNYEWDFGDSSSPSPAPDPSHVFPGPGTYTVKLSIKSTLYGSTDDTSMQVTVLENPVAAFKHVNACEGLALSFQNNSTVNTGTLNYEWEFGDGGTSTAENPTHVYANAGAFQVTLTVETANSGCRANTSKTVYQFARPVPDFTLPSNGICIGSELEITNNSTLSSGRQGALWTFGDGGYSTVFNGLHTYSSPGTYQVKLLAVSEFDCRDSIEKSIDVKVTPTPSFTNNKLCSRTTANFVNTSVETFPNPSYKWTFSDNFISTQKNVSRNWPMDGKYQVTLEANYTNGCSASVISEIDVLSQPVADFSVDNICSGENAVFLNKTVDSRGDIEYFWNYVIGTSTEHNPVVPFNNPTTTTYSVLLVAAYPDQCRDSSIGQFTVSENPVCDFTFQNMGYLKYSFAASNAGYSKYLWNFGTGDISETSSSVYQYQTMRIYDVTLEAENAAGCRCKKTIEIEMNLGIDDLNNLNGVMVAPNPNKGSFTVSNQSQLGMFIEVYDVLGKKVFSQTTAEASMTITLDNEAQGVYFVHVNINGVLSTTKIVVTN